MAVANCCELAKTRGVQTVNQVVSRLQTRRNCITQKIAAKADGGRHMGIRVLLADDHELVRHGLCKILDQQQDIEVIAEVGDGQAAVRLAREVLPDVIILDITMPVLNGLDAARAILAENPGARIIMLSMHHAERIVRDTLAAGASYLGTRVTKAVTSGFLANVTGPNTSVFAKLSAKEREVLQLLAEGNA